MKEAPWSNKKTLSTEDKEERLSLEILEFVKYISPTPNEFKKRHSMQKTMGRFVEREFPGLKAVPFGSHCTELCLPGSDIDVDIRSISGEEVPKQTLNRLKKCLLRTRMCRYDDMLFVPKAKVPVLTIDSPEYFMAIDFTLNNPSPSSDRTILWIEQYPELRPMYLVLKHALLGLQHPRPNFVPMSSKNNGMASYTLICLIVNFLEVEAKKRGCDPSLETYYADLLLEFLDFYSSFDFATKGIRFDHQNPYFPKGATNSIMIQDPDVPDSNVARSASMIVELKECFAFLYDSLIGKPADRPQNSILERIIPVDQQLPLTGAQRLEGRDYKIQPLIMTQSNSWKTALRQKMIRSKDRQRKREQKRMARESDQSRYDDTFYGGSNGDGNFNNKRNNKKRKWKGNDHSFFDSVDNNKNNKKHRPSSSKK